MLYVMGISLCAMALFCRSPRPGGRHFRYSDGNRGIRFCKKIRAYKDWYKLLRFGLLLYLWGLQKMILLDWWVLNGQSFYYPHIYVEFGKLCWILAKAVFASSRNVKKVWLRHSNRLLGISFDRQVSFSWHVWPVPHDWIRYLSHGSIPL